MNINSCFNISGLTGPAEAASARGDRWLGFKDSACLGVRGVLGTANLPHVCACARTARGSRAGRRRRAVPSSFKWPEEDASGKGEPCHPAEPHPAWQGQRSAP